MWQGIERVAQRQSVKQEPGAVEARAAFSLWDTFDNMWQTFDNLWDSFDNNWDPFDSAWDTFALSGTF